MPEAVKTVGHYEILRELGRGGMATVHLARLRGDILWVLTTGPDFLHRYDAIIGTRLSSTEVGAGAKSMVVSAGDPDTGDVREVPVGERPFSLVLAEDGIRVGDTAENKVRFVKP